MNTGEGKLRGSGETKECLEGEKLRDPKRGKEREERERDRRGRKKRLGKESEGE